MLSMQQIQQAIDGKTKPLGSLGKLETLAAQLCHLQQSLVPEISKPAVLVFAADHGLALEGVSPYPQDVTWQMVMNFLSGGAAINIFARQHGLDLKVVDAGVNYNFEPGPGLLDCKVAPGTASALHGNAMTSLQRQQAMAAGARLVSELHSGGCNTLCLGEMGIGNTSAAALIMSLSCQLPLADCIGRGAGADDAQLRRKQTVLEAVLNRHQTAKTAEQIIEAVGGFEIAMMTGAIIEACRNKMAIVVDGFISTSSVLLARNLGAPVETNCIYSHCSDEQGHRRMLAELGAEPLLQLGLRLGEGSGAALAMGLVQSAAGFMAEMASFESAGVSERIARKEPESETE